jgi:glycosyltransferase involved in cell wall biosynthesis
MQYNICFISFSHLSKDARSLNIINTYLSNTSNKILVISLDEEFAINSDQLTHIKIKSNSNNSWLRWWKFNREVKKHFNYVIASYYYACDLYSLVISSYFAKHFNGTLNYDSREIYSALGALAKKPFRQWILTQIEKKCINLVRTVITSGKYDSEYLKENLYPDKEYLEILNLPPFKEKTNSNAIREKFSIPLNKKIILYQGVVHFNRGLDEILNAMPLIQDKFVLCIVGDGPKIKHYKEVVTSLQLENVVFFFGSVDYDELHAVTCSADIGICMFNPVSKSYEFSLPNKLFEYSMAGLPILATNLPQQEKVITEFHNGVLIEPYSKPDLIKLKLEEIIDKFDELGKNSLECAKSYHYSTQNVLILNLMPKQF